MFKKLLKLFSRKSSECNHQFMWVRDESQESLTDPNAIIRVNKCIYCGKIRNKELVIYKPNHEVVKFEIV